MKNNKIAYQLFLLLFGIALVFSSCKKEKDYTDIDFWATGWSTEIPLEFYVDGVRVQPKFPEVVPEHRPGNLFEASSGGKESVTVDFWITYNGTVYTSIPDRAKGPVSPSFSLSADETIAGSEYIISPTGDYNDPWNIDKVNDDGGGPCFTGTWVQNVSDCNASGAEKVFYFNGNGTGYASNVIIQGFGDNCVILCTVKFNYNWTDLGNNNIKIKYTSVENDCGQSPETPDPDTLSITCNGSSINISGQVYQKR